MKKVQVLMSTYNGEKYLREQIDSILEQEYKEIALLIRDDGSVDGTLSILQEYADKYENVVYYAGENLGVQKSFFDLMKNADESAAYYAFSDQDDVWLPEKIKRAVELLELENSKLTRESVDIPLLYASKTILVDEKLKVIPMKIREYNIVPSFGNALVENICTGCTEVFNKALLKLVKKKIPEFTVMHDWWLYLSAAAFGKVFYDKEGYILYRQHSNNQVGMQNTWYRELRNRIRNYRKYDGALHKQAAEFRRIYGSDYPNCQLTNWVADYKKVFCCRCNVVMSCEIHRQRKVDDLIFRGLFLLGQR